MLQAWAQGLLLEGSSNVWFASLMLLRERAGKEIEGHSWHEVWIDLKRYSGAANGLVLISTAAAVNSDTCITGAGWLAFPAVQRLAAPSLQHSLLQVGVHLGPLLL